MRSNRLDFNSFVTIIIALRAQFLETVREVANMQVSRMVLRRLGRLQTGHMSQLALFTTAHPENN